MAAKLLHSLTDDNPDLQKQIGCMTGILQLFDRQHMLTGSRRAVGHSPRRLPTGSSNHNIVASENESNNAHLKFASPEKYAQKNVHERQRVSTESSRASFSSSSHSSSFSSPECNRAAQLEQASFDKMIFSENPSVDTATSLEHPSPQFSRQAIDLRDFVKDSMYREIQGLSVKAKAIESKTAKAIESKTSDGSRGSGLDKKERTPDDLKESLKALAKLQEVSRYRNEHRELLRSSSYHFKDGPSFAISRDAPRFSYDGRDINRMPFDSGDVSKNSIKLRDLPRLSLDSREASIPSLNSDSKSNLSLKNVAKDNGGLDGKFQTQKQMPGNQARPPSVVAKLMGLDVLPDSISCGDISTGLTSHLDKEFVGTSSSSEKAEQIKPVQVSSTSKNSWKDPSSPRWRSPDGSMKPLSRFPIEPAPWKQIDGLKGSQKPASKGTRSPAKGSTAFPSVYSEIEKRLKDLEFNQSGKDLRALKQILEAMQAKGLLKTPKEGQDSNFSSHEDDERILIGSTKLVDNRRPQPGQVLGTTRRKAASSENHESPIVIMKPVKLVEKSGIPAASVISVDSISGLPKLHGSGSGRMAKDQILKSGERVNCLIDKTGDKTVKTVPSSARSQQMAKEANAGSGKSSGSISPRMQQKKLELEKKSRLPSSPDSGRSTRQSNKQQVEYNSPSGRRRMKHQKSSEQMSEVSVESRHLTPQENEDLAWSNLSFIRGSKNSQVTNSERSPSLSSSRSPSAKPSELMLSNLKSTVVINEEESPESGFVPPEYSSPISVLENVLCKQDSPSPVKYIGKTLKVETSTINERTSNAVQQSTFESFAPISAESGAAFEINRRKLRNIENLVQKLRRLNSTHDEARTDYIASLCENTDPDHRYISEILLASGLLLRDLTDFQFHPSGHALNPELFLVLEQTKARKPSMNECGHERKVAVSTTDKIHRKLIFDVVNETLAGRLAPNGPHSEPWIRPVKLARKTLNAQKLLRELCKEIDALQANNPKCSEDEDDDAWKTILCEDVMHRSEHWMDFHGEVSGAVLDIERLIFKDLVNEIVMGEPATMIAKPRSKASPRK